ncbi:hypothetical protein [Desertivirga xinjiangensis]|uniref:hypothetical protein n=1 Tax=Desertivirga xinjiangensis TaxID=539206 RepID=UPI00210A2FB5|nr:hypothetical protein [Pedobacter xinjiangensis]
MEYSIAQSLIDYTVQNSSFENRRNYVSLSNSHLNADEIYSNYINGFVAGKKERLKCYKGYQMEKDLLNRIQAVYGPRVKVDIELSAFDGLVKGHPDFTFDDYPGDCKSVLLDEWLPKDGKLPKKVYWQMQSYMKYAKKDKALVIYESRESGLIIDIWIKQNPNIQNAIHEKNKSVVNKINLSGSI